MRNKLSPKKQALYNALKKYFSNISSACEACNVSRGAYYQWYEKDSLFRQMVDDLRLVLDDNIETVAISKCLNEKDPSLIMFMLRTRLRHRGYAEKTQIEQTGELKIMQESTIDFSKLTVAELRVLKALTEKAKKDNKENQI